MSAAGRQYRVLVVDDEEPILQVVDRTLRDAGYQTALARNGRAALDVASVEPTFDLLLTDLMMPGMRGDDLARRLWVGHPDLKVLYLTGFPDSLFVGRPLLWDNEKLLEKPASPQELLKAVSVALFGNPLGPGD